MTRHDNNFVNLGLFVSICLTVHTVHISLKDDGSFDVLSRLALYSLCVYYTVCSSSLKVAPVLEMNPSLQ